MYVKYSQRYSNKNENNRGYNFEYRYLYVEVVFMIYNYLWCIMFFKQYNEV